MKPLNYTKTLIALALAVAATASFSQAQEQPLSPPASDSALPADITPGSPLAEVVKLVQGGVDVATIKSYIVNAQSAFNLDADKILVLKDEGVPSDLVNAMLERDKILYAGTIAPTPAPAPANYVASTPDTAPPAAEVNVNYFNDTLTPYGSWVEVDGYGRCWRPTTVIYDSNWRPYCDRGHWVYTDCGWYWDSDYSWGVTFHYGRWFRHARFGWCWYPDTVWAPSWVTWRSGGDYCGWAPLPPLAVFRPGSGFYYRGARVGVDFDFGLDAGVFMFVSPSHFRDRHPRSYCAPPERVTQIFRQTTVINNFNENNKTIINRGIPVQHINDVTHRTIEPVRVGSLPNAGRQGWHGPVDNIPARNSSTGNGQLRHGPALQNNQNNNGNANPHQSFGQPAQPVKPVGNQVEPVRPPVQNRPQPVITDHAQPQNGLHAPQQEPTPQHNASSAPGNSAAQNDWRQNRSVESSTPTVPQQHGATQLQQHQPVTPGVSSQPHISPEPQAPTPAPSQPHNASNGTGQGSGRDKQNY